MQSEELRCTDMDNEATPYLHLFKEFASNVVEYRSLVLTQSKRTYIALSLYLTRLLITNGIYLKQLNLLPD